MGARVRTRTLNRAVPGSVAVSALGGEPSVQFGSTSYTYDEICADTTEPPPYRDPHTLTLNKRVVEPLRVNGTAQHSIFTSVYSDYNPEFATGFANAADPAFLVDWDFWITKALANMNPNVPDTDGFLFLFELKDFPRMLRNLGDVLSKGINPKTVTGGHLAYEFGWKPLISDLSTLLDFGESINRRVRYLKGLGGSGERLKRTLYEDESRTGTWDHQIDETLTLRWEQLEKTRIWFTARPYSDLALPTDIAPLVAARAAIGASPSWSTLWNALPWSWFIDYFANIGDILEANRGWFPVQYPVVHLMATLSREDLPYSAVVNTSQLEWSGGRLTNTWKLRQYYVNPTPQFALTPALSGRKMAILGSLVTSLALGASVPTS